MNFSQGADQGIDGWPRVAPALVCRHSTQKAESREHAPVKRFQQRHVHVVVEEHEVCLRRDARQIDETQVMIVLEALLSQAHVLVSPCVHAVACLSESAQSDLHGLVDPLACNVVKDGLAGVQD